MVSLLRGMEPETLDLEMALRLLSLPRDLGPHPEDEEQKPVLALTGPLRPLRQVGQRVALDPRGRQRPRHHARSEAVELLKQPRRRGRRRDRRRCKDLGEHPESGATIRHDGRYGPYVTDGEINASLPQGPAARDPDDRRGRGAPPAARRAHRRPQGGGSAAQEEGRDEEEGRQAEEEGRTTKKKAAKPKKKPAAKKTGAAKKKASAPGAHGSRPEQAGCRTHPMPRPGAPSPCARGRRYNTPQQATHELDAVFRPRTIAVVGASRRPGSVGPPGAARTSWRAGSRARSSR